MTARRFLAPEVIQTSEMDCGPATLKCILEGFGISVSYGRLREACQTDVDGTSIDTMEEVANQLGLEAEQTMVPEDHLLLPEAETLPAIVITTNPNGLTHFVVVWRIHGPFIQVMDPAVGRRWLTKPRFLRDLFIHTMPFPAAAWRAWAGTPGFGDPLLRRLLRLELPEPVATRLLETALADESWRGLAALDAATRLVTSLVQANGLLPGPEAERLLAKFFDQTQADPAGATGLIPEPYWTVQPGPVEPAAETGADEGEDELILLRGAVLVRMLSPGSVAPVDHAPEVEPQPLSPELAAALAETPSQPLLELWRFLRQDGLAPFVIVAGALALLAAGGLIEAVLLRGLLDFGRSLSAEQRAGGLAVFFSFAVAMALLQLPVQATIIRLGRRLEARLRMAFLRKIPRLNDRYFQSRLISDMTQRAHDLRSLRALPGLGSRLVQTGFQLVLTMLVVILLDPGSTLIAILATLSAVALSILSQPLTVEQDLRLRTHLGALSRFYLDALLGLVAIRTHAAERTIRREHEGLLVEWARTGYAVVRTNLALEAVQAVVSTLFSIWLLFNYVAQGGSPAGVLLIFYWTLNLPSLGRQLAGLLQEYPLQRNRLLRFLEPLGAPEEIETGGSELEPPRQAEQPLGHPEESPAGLDPAPQATNGHDQTEIVWPRTQGVRLDFDGVTVQAAGHTILSEIDLTVEAGEHVAIVGPSGAGKSSLVGLLLGWHRPAAGQVRVDGQRLSGARLLDLRRETAWVDPAVQLWNRSLLENLRYGAPETNAAPLNKVLEQADLFEVLERMPNGLQTPLGEGGGLVSGGEGQRVRLGRAMLRAEARLAILDEPFRGLDRDRRWALLAQARQVWQRATLLCITHDVGQTRDFDRVFIIEAGRLVEAGQPTVLLARPDSRYRALLDAETAVREQLWSGTAWRRLYLDNGQLEERTGALHEEI